MFKKYIDSTPDHSGRLEFSGDSNQSESSGDSNLSEHSGHWDQSKNPGLPIGQKRTKILLDGRTVTVPTGVSVAAALLEIGELISRISPSSGKPCAPHCLMGVCHECLMEINGVKRQACMTDVAEGMVINRNLNNDQNITKGGRS